MSDVNYEQLELHFSDERMNRKIIKNLRLDSPHIIDNPFIEQFIVIGSDVHQNPQFHNFGWKTKSAVVHPKILFKFPPTDITGFGYHLLTQFCFPSNTFRFKKTGKSSREIARTIERSTTSHLDYNRSFVYVFTGGETEIYAICLTKEHIISKQNGEYDINEICYVLLSTHPFFMLHFKFLESILSLPEIDSFIQNPSINLHEVTFNSIPIYVKNMINSIVEYSSFPLPTPSKPFKYTFPNSKEQIVYPYSSDPLLFNHSEVFLLTLFHRFKAKNLMYMLSAFLLEHKMLIISKNRHLLSAAIFFLLSMVHPFQFESSIVCVLCEELYPVIEAPTPLLMGMTEIPKDVSIPKEYTFIANLDDNQFIGNNVDYLPGSLDWIEEEIQHKLKSIKPTPKATTTELITLEKEQAYSLTSVIRKGVEELVKPFPYFCITNVHEEGKENISSFMTDSFVSSWGNGDGLEFIEKFVKTQMFENFKTRELIRIDAGKGFFY
ncbi:UDENN domain-containing protein [Entamoeba marina]